jgi:Kef-type K+ transport system membrane component KefB
LSTDFLTDIFFYFLATVSFIPLFKKIGFGPITGYLCAGLVLGPNVLAILENSGEVETISEIGVILLMFIIGLELSFSRLFYLKNFIFKYGVGQFALTTTVLTLLSNLVLKSWPASLIVAFSLTLSSTAFSLKYLRDSKMLTKSYGQISFSILLFQDIIVIPIMALIPLMTLQSEMNFSFENIFKGLLFCGLIVSGKKVLPQMVSKVHKLENKELFISINLLIISGCALLANSLGLSKALGAFLAGLFLSESALKNEIQNLTLPLKSMLLGVFFMAFGLKIDLSIFNTHSVPIVLSTFLFMSVKFLIIFAMIKRKHQTLSANITGIVLCSGGEFGLLTLAIAHQNFVITDFVYQFVSSITILSIFFAPILSKVLDKIVLPDETATVDKSEDQADFPIKKVA